MSSETPETPNNNPQQASDHHTQINASVNVHHAQGGQIEAIHIDRIEGQVAVGFSAADVERLLLEIRSEFQPRSFNGESPYKGLQAFQEADAGRFFGREHLVEQLLQTVDDRRFIVVAGPSGSGKSSLVRAGLIPALKKGAISASRTWLYATLRPGREPMLALGRAVAGLAGSLQAAQDLQNPDLQDETVLAQWLEIALGDGGDRRAMLFIDQFEELFTQLQGEDERRRTIFLNQILHAAHEEAGRTLMVITLRSDFIANCAAYPTLNALLNRGFLQVGAMRAEELVSAIARPALQVGLQVDPDLIAQIIADMRDQPGALPLMQFALQDLFESSRTTDGVAALTLEAYLARGGLHRALERYADQAFTSLTTQEQEIARAVFAGLVQPGQGRQDTRRTALFSELVPAGQAMDQVEGVIHKLADARLVITAERDTDLEAAGLLDSRAVTLAHERLLEAWPWLSRLVDENREAIAQSNQINADAQRWRSAGEDESYLYSGARLAAAEQAFQEGRLALSELAAQFLEVAIDARDASQRAVRRRTRFTLGALTAAALIFALMAVWGFLSQREANFQAATADFSSTQAAAQAHRAVQAQELAETRAAEATHALGLSERNARIAVSRQLAAYSLNQPGSAPDLALLLAAQAGTIFDTFEAQTSLLTLLTDYRNLRAQIYTDPVRASQKVISSGGLLVTQGCNLSSQSTSYCELRFWDLAFGRELADPVILDHLIFNDIAFSPQGNMLAIAVCDEVLIPNECPARRILVYSLEFENGTLSTSPLIELNLGQGFSTRSLAFHPAGARLAVTACIDRSEISGDCTQSQITHWSLPDGILLPEKILFPSGEVTGSTQPPPQGELSFIRYSPDGDWIAAANAMGRVNVYDADTGMLEYSFLEPGIRSLSALEFSSDSGLLAVAGCETLPIFENCVGIVDTYTIQNGELKNRHFIYTMSGVSSIAFTPQGDLRAVGNCHRYIENNTCEAGETVVWSQTLSVSSYDFALPQPGYLGLVLSPDGKYLTALDMMDDIVLIWDLQMNWIGGLTIKAHVGAIETLDYHAETGLLVSAGEDGNVTLWRLAESGLPPDPLSVEPVTPTPLVDDQNLSDEVDDSFPLARLSLNLTTQSPITALDISPDGTHLAVAECRNGRFMCETNQIHVWDLTSAQEIALIADDYARPIIRLVFSPDGSLVAALHEGDPIEPSIISVWAVPGGELLSPYFAAPLFTSDLSFSPDSKDLYAYSGKLLTIWDRWEHNPDSRTVELPNAIHHLAFSPQGDLLAVVSPSGVVQYLDPVSLEELEFSTTASDPDWQDWSGATGNLLLSQSETSSIYLWNSKNHQQIGGGIGPRRLSSRYNAITYIADIQTLVIGTSNGELILWDTRLQSWIEQACRIASRVLTPQEWDTYVGPEVPYEPACAQ